MRINCPVCGAGYNVPAEVEGAATTCAECGEPFRIRPLGDAAIPAAEPPAAVPSRRQPTPEAHESAPIRPSPGRTGGPAAWSFRRLVLAHFLSTLTAIIIGGAILLVGVREYLHWTMREIAREYQKSQAEYQQRVK